MSRPAAERAEPAPSDLRVWRPAATATPRVALSKRIEARLRLVRPFVDPRRALDYLAVVRGHGAPRGGRPLAWCDFRSTEIDTVGGCHVYQLTRELLGAGYEPVFRRNFLFLASMRSKPYKRLLGGSDFATARREPAGAAITVTDDPAAAARSGADRVVFVDYTIRGAGASEVALPYCMSPFVSAAAERPTIDPDAPRTVGVFFAGTTGDHDYDRAVLRDRYGMLTRSEAIAAVLGARDLPLPFRLRAPEDLGLLRGGCEIALSIDGGCRVPQREWLATVAMADFWLGCPGTQMPMCHNLVEALSVGTVPILEYDRYTTPPLEDGVNCIAFRGADGPAGIASAVRRALATPEPQRRRMCRAAVEFYERHHAPGTFVAKLLAAGRGPVTLLLNEHRAPRVAAPVGKALRRAA